MRVLIVNSFYYPNLIGGCEHSVKLLAESLLNKGIDVSVFTIDNTSSERVLTDTVNGVYIYRANAGLYDVKTKLHIRKNYVRRVLNRFIELNNNTVMSIFEDIVIQIQPDIVHTNNLYGISYAIWKKCNDLKIPFVHTLRDYYIISPLFSLTNLKKNMLTRVFHYFYQKHYRKMSESVLYITSPSKRTIDIFTNEYSYFQNAFACCIHNYVELDKGELQKIIQKRMREPIDIIKFIYIGGLLEMKGIGVLLEQFQLIANSNVQLIICGRGPLENKVLEASKGDRRIRFYKQVSPEERDKLLTEAHVCVVPSLYDEPFGRVVIESNKFGLPVIGSNMGGIKEIIDDIHTGELFDASEYNTLGDRLKAFSNPLKIKSYYKNIENNLEKYSGELVIEKYLDFYQCSIAGYKEQYI